MLPVKCIIIMFRSTCLGFRADWRLCRSQYRTVIAIAEIVCVGQGVPRFETGNLVFRKVVKLLVLEPLVTLMFRIRLDGRMEVPCVSSRGDVIFAGRRRPQVALMAAWSVLVVQVEMGRATSRAVLARPTVPRVDCMPVTCTGHVKVIPIMNGLLLTPCMMAPLSFKINLRTDMVAGSIHPLAVHVVAVRRTTLCKQSFIRWLFQEDVDVALNLLCGRPVDLSILLKALHGFVGFAKLCLTISPTLVVVIVAVQVMARLPLAISRLAFGLCAIALSILLNVCAVGISAPVAQSLPLLVLISEQDNLVLKPHTSGTINLQLIDL
jgi:hypothetical protein